MVLGSAFYAGFIDLTLFVLCILAVAAVETAIGLGITVLFSSRFGSIDLSRANILRG